MDTTTNNDNTGMLSTLTTGEQQTRTLERTSRQKITIPQLEKLDTTSAKLWWRRFTQYIKMTRDFDLSEMTNDKEIFEEYRERLELEIKDTFVWALGETAIQEMTRTVRGREPTTLPLHRLYSLFRIHFIPERNKYHSRADFFNIQREPGESAADIWKRILEIEKKCEFEDITAAELLASKFLSVIGKSTGDYELKKKIKKSDYSIDAITDAIHEHMYEKLNESSESQDGRRIKHIQERKRYQKAAALKIPPTKKKFGYKDCTRCGAPNWTPKHLPECPAKNKKCSVCQKLGHFAKVCKSKTKIHLIRDEATSSAEEDNWTPNKLHLISETVNAMTNKDRNGRPYYTTTLLVNFQPIKFIIDTGSPVTLIPKSKFNNHTILKPMNTKYKDVNDNHIQFEGKTIATIQNEGQIHHLELLVTTNETNPLLGLDWMEALGIELQTTNTETIIHNIVSNEDEQEIKEQFRKLFNENETIKNIEVDIELKPGAKLIQQKGRPIPIHLQADVEKEINKLIKSGHLEKADDINENCFVSPAVITVKKDKSVKIALDSRKLNDITIKRKAQMPNMEELMSRISRRIADGEKDEIWISKLDLDYAYGQLKLSERAKNLCVFTVTGGKFTGYYKFLKGFYGLADIPTVFQEKIDKTLQNKHPAWLDDILIVTKGNKEQHKLELMETLTRLEKEGYRLSAKKSEFFRREIEWIGHKIDQDGIRPIQDKLESIKNLKRPNNEKELKSFLGAIQYLSKYIENLSANTDFLRQLLKKKNSWNWTSEHDEAFENIKKKITNIPCLAHYNTNLQNILTTDDSTKGLGATLWQEQPDKSLKPIAFASRFLTDTEKKYAINELELLAVVWGLEHFRLYIYGKPIKLLTDHQALEPLLKRNRSNKTYSARLTRWLDRLAHFDININHIAGNHLALTDYLRRNPVMNANSDDIYDEEYVINCIIPLHAFTDQFGCLSNAETKSTSQTSQSETRGVNKTAADKQNQSKIEHSRIQLVNLDRKMPIKNHIIDRLAELDQSEDTQRLIARYREIIKPGVYRKSGGKWKRYHEPKSLRPEKLQIEEKLLIIITNL